MSVGSIAYRWTPFPFENYWRAPMKSGVLPCPVYTGGADQEIKDKTFWDYDAEKSALDTAQPSRADQVWKCLVTRFNPRRTARILWSRLIPFRCAVGSGSASILLFGSPSSMFISEL